ncbi:unnamed protein product [Pylaiella littoralis]
MATFDGEGAVGFGVIRLEPTGIKLGATGISSSYDDGYPQELEGWISKEEWLECIGRINNALMDRFPCGLCRLQAYCCCPCTLGLSLLSMRSQAKEIERGVGEVVSSVNRNLEARKIEVRFDFRRRWCRAWVQVDYGPAVSLASPSTSAKAPPLSSSLSSPPPGAAAAASGAAASSSRVPAPSASATATATAVAAAAAAPASLGTGRNLTDRDGDHDGERRKNSFDRSKRVLPTVSVAAMSGATQPFGEEPLLERGGGSAVQ